MPEITEAQHADYRRLELAERLFDLYEPLRFAEDLPVEIENVLAGGTAVTPAELRASIAETQAACRRFDTALSEALTLLDPEQVS